MGNKAWVRDRDRDSGLIHIASRYMSVFIVGIYRIDLMMNLKKNKRFVLLKMMIKRNKRKES